MGSTRFLLVKRRSRQERRYRGVGAVPRLSRQLPTPAWGRGAEDALIFSRLCARTSAIASRVSPCPLAPGTSAQYPIYHGPCCSTIAVNSCAYLYSAGGRLEPDLGNAAIRVSMPPDVPVMKRTASLAGAAAAEIIAIASFALVFLRGSRFSRALHPVPASPSALLISGMAQGRGSSILQRSTGFQELPGPRPRFARSGCPCLKAPGTGSRDSGRNAQRPWLCLPAPA